MRNTATLKKICAFTLIELLVVIAIIAVLVSILMPSLAAARQQAQQLVCANNLGQIGKAMMFYSDESNAFLPPVTGLWQTTAEYIGMPLPDVLDFANWSKLRKDAMPSVLYCPCDSDPFPWPHMGFLKMELTSYLANGSDTTMAMGNGPAIQIGLFGGKGRISDAVSPAECFAVGENYNYDRVLDMDHPIIAELLAKTSALGQAATMRARMHHRATAAFYHHGRMNLCFLDGHVASIVGIDADGSEVELPTTLATDGSATFTTRRMPSSAENVLFWGPPYDQYQ
jgi:prepilin-type N-terminal cleavage/methylation domain-containing protein/prepilin-type processing-associated H-X9-DG protein